MDQNSLLRELESLKRETETLNQELTALREENEILAEQAEDIFLLGIISEKLSLSESPSGVIATTLENVCILKDLAYGALLRVEGESLRVIDDYCEDVECSYREIDFPLEDAWVGMLEVGVVEFAPPVPLPPFIPQMIKGRGPRSAIFLHFGDDPGRPGDILVFVNYRFPPDYLNRLVPLINRVVSLAWMRTETLRLLEELSLVNTRLEKMVAERTGELEDTVRRLSKEIQEREAVEQRLRESEEKFRLIYEEAVDGIVVIEGDTGLVVDCNRAFERLSGRDKEELKGMRIWQLRPPDKIEEARLKFEEIREKGLGGSRQLDFQRPDGSRVPIEFLSRVISFKGRKYHLSIVRDLSERYAMIQEIEKKNQELKIIHSLINRAQQSLSLEEAVESVEGALKELLSPALIMFYQMRGERLVLLRGFPGDAGAFKEEKEIGECLCGLAAKEMRPVLSGDILSDPRCTLDECKNAGMRTFAAIPLGVEGQLNGLLGLAWRERRDLSEERGFFESIGAGLSIVFRNISLYEELRRNSERLEMLVRERTEELQRAVNLMAGREVRMAELKEVIRRLRGQLVEAGIEPGADDPLNEEDDVQP